jgi:hypothetical protein
VSLTKLSNSTSFCTETIATLHVLLLTFSPTPSPSSQQSVPTANETSESLAPIPIFVPTKNVTSSSPQPTAFSRLEKVKISLIGCNIYNYTTQDITSENNNNMIATIEGALNSISSFVITDERERRNLGSFKAFAPHRHLNTANDINVTVLSVENAGKLDHDHVVLFSYLGTFIKKCW